MKMYFLSALKKLRDWPWTYIFISAFLVAIPPIAAAILYISKAKLENAEIVLLMIFGSSFSVITVFLAVKIYKYDVVPPHKLKPHPKLIDGDKNRMTEILVSLITANYSHIEHYQNQRTTFANLFFLIVAAVLTVVGLDKEINKADAFPLGFLFVISCFGTLFTVKYFERGSSYYTLLKEYKAMLDDKVLEWDMLKTINKNLEDKHLPKFKVIRHPKWGQIFKLSSMWTMFHLLVVVTSGVLLFSSYLLPISFKDAVVVPAPSTGIVTSPVNPPILTTETEVRDFPSPTPSGP